VRQRIEDSLLPPTTGKRGGKINKSGHRATRRAGESEQKRVAISWRLGPDGEKPKGSRIRETGTGYCVSGEEKYVEGGFNSCFLKPDMCWSRGSNSCAGPGYGEEYRGGRGE